MFNDFRGMGRGIASRYQRCHEWWAPHLRCTGEFLRQHVPLSERVAVLGAGRLLDLDLSWLLSRAREVHLFDADPGCVGVWRAKAGPEFRRRVVPHLEDLTSCLDQWTRPVQAEVRGGRLVSYVEGLRAPQPTWSRAAFDGIISLNLLGQIPLYWRDRVLSRQPSLSSEEGRALANSMGELQRAHLAALKPPPGGWRILITDTEYYFYSVDTVPWRVEPALHGRAETALRRLTAAAPQEAWLWHLAPQFVEDDTEGEIHRVEAFVVNA